MGGARWPVDRLVHELDVLAGRGLPRAEFFREVAGRLRRVVEADATCWHTLDPETLVMTSDAPEELIEQGVFTPEGAVAAGAGIVASEYLRDDLNRFAALASRRAPVGILSDATRGRPERSARYREVLAPAGIPFELRAAFVTRGRCWGAVHIARRDDKRDFTREDAPRSHAFPGRSPTASAPPCGSMRHDVPTTRLPRGWSSSALETRSS